MDEKPNLNKNNNQGSNYLNTISLLIITIMLFGVCVLGYKLVKSVLEEQIEVIKEEKEEEKEKEKTTLKEQFSADRTVIYTITTKDINNKLTNNGYFTIKDNETNKVYIIQVSKEMYYQMATNQTLEAIISKDNKSIKLVDSEEYFDLEEIIF